MDAVTDPRDTSKTLNTVTSAMAEELQASMDAVADPRDTSETLADLPSATSNIAPGGEKVKGESVESVENAESYADVTLKADAGELDSESWNRTEQLDAARQLVRDARMSTKGVQTVVNNMPQGVGAEIYAPAAASLYRLGVVEDVASFEDALRLTGKDGMSARVQQVMALGKTGEAALKIAYLQGKGEAEQYRLNKAAELGKRPGQDALREDAGTYTKNGKLSEGKSARDALIELTAKGTAVAAEQKVELQKGAKGELQAAIGKVFYSAEADTATVLHETLHEVNHWSNETGQELIDTFHHYLVQQNGMESVQELVQGYMERYEKAGQALSYNQAMEEVTADAMQTIFGTEESFRHFLRLQASEARMNAAAEQRTNRVMAKIETLLKKVLSDIKSLIVRQPDNAAAKAAQSLTEQQLKDLRDIYFAHQIEAGANYRAALEESGMKKAADVETTAVESRFQIDEDFERAINELEKKKPNEMIVVGTTSEALMSIGVKDQTILWNAGKIKKILAKHSAENYKANPKESVMTKDVIKRIPRVLENPLVILHSSETQTNEKGKDYRSRIYMFGDVKDAAGKTVNVVLELLPTNQKGLAMDNVVVASAYGKNAVQEMLSRDQILYVEPNKKRTASWLNNNRLQLPFYINHYGSQGRLAYFGEVVKMLKADSRNGKLASLLQVNEGTRYQLDVDEEDVAAARQQSVGDGGTETQIIQTVMETAQGASVKHESLEMLAKRLIRRTASRADTQTITNRLAALNTYLASGDVDYAVAHSIMLDVTQQVMEKSAKRNDELWKVMDKVSGKKEKGFSFCIYFV